MMTEQLGFSVLSAPLAAIDRRALSQAWFSSLHLAHQRTEAVGPAPSKVVRTSDRTGGPRPAYGCKPDRTATSTQRRSIRSDDAKRTVPAEERRASRSPLARKIERAFLDPRLPAARTSFSFGTASARVHVTLARVQGAARLIAICSPATRDAVARALEQARYALAQRGIALSIVLEDV